MSKRRDYPWCCTFHSTGGERANACAEARRYQSDSMLPTREQLEALLWSDRASEAFEDDAREILRSEEDPIDAATAAMDTVGSECSETGWALEGESARADLRFVVTGAKRGAILLLHAAWVAESALRRPRVPKPEASAESGAEQLSLLSEKPETSR